MMKMIHINCILNKKELLCLKKKKKINVCLPTVNLGDCYLNSENSNSQNKAQKKSVLYKCVCLRTA